MRHIWGIGTAVLLVGCGAGERPNRLEEFGKVRQGFLVPCTLRGPDDEPFRGAFAVAEAQGRCIDGFGDLISTPSFQCGEWATIVPPEDGCLTGVSSSEFDLMSFVVSGAPDPNDFTGSQGNRVTIAPCDRGEPEDIVTSAAEADIEVLSDDGLVAEVRLSSELASGLLELEVCR